MIDLFYSLVGLVYLLIVGLLFVFGLNFYYLTYLSIKRKAPPLPETPKTWPKVTVQLPVYNELYVVERLIESAANLDYPIEQLQIQVLDDSTDETSMLAGQAVEKVMAGGIQIVHLHRSERTGFKAGALAEGMAQASGEFLVVFDADFVPGPDFLKKTIPYFQDPQIAFLQTRWSHLNRGYSILTLLQSLIIDAHFMVEQTARSRSGYWFNFNGTAGVWRKSAIQDAGGWKSDTLTEDLDLSYRALLRGWKAAYLRDVQVPAELPVTITAYRRQQYRWARGSLEVAQRHLGEVFQARTSIWHKLQAILHLGGYGIHILLFAVSLLYPLILKMTNQYSLLLPLFNLALFFNITAFAQTIFFVVAQQQLGHRWWKLLPVIFLVSALGAGMMLNTVKASYEIFKKKKVGFERTPKFGIDGNQKSWNHKRYQLGIDWIVFFELCFAVFNGLTLFYAIQSRNWVIAFYSLMFCCGMLFTSGLSFQQALSLKLKRGPAAIPMNIASPVQAIPTDECLLQSVLKTVAYADVFDSPLTVQEITRYQIRSNANVENIQAALDHLLQLKKLSFRAGVYMLPGREGITEARQRRQKVAERMWPKAIAYGRIISRLPFVRLVAITGALAVNNVDEGADIDYLIVTEPGRVWFCRGLVILLVRLASLRGVTLCPNYLLSERAMVFSDRSLYTAHELTQMVPIYGEDVYARVRMLNSWTDQFLPNASGKPGNLGMQITGKGQNRFQSLAEGFLRTSLGDRIEHWEMVRKIRKFNLTQTDSVESSFCADWCKGHFNRHGEKTMNSYTSRLEMIDRVGGMQAEV